MGLMFIGGQDMRIPAYLVILLIVTFAAPLQAASGGGGGGVAPQQSMKRLTPEEKAAASYDSGTKHRDRAEKYERQAIEQTNEKKLAKLQKKIAREYARAIKDYERSIGHYERFSEAHNSVGYALRKVGRYEESLAAYNVAIRINPYFDQAIEYRGEAYLGLNRLDEAKEAYIELFQNDRTLAEQLMAAMIVWVGDRRDDANGLESAVVEQFAVWVEQRSELASFVHPMNDAARFSWAELR